MTFNFQVVFKVKSELLNAKITSNMWFRLLNQSYNGIWKNYLPPTAQGSMWKRKCNSISGVPEFFDFRRLGYAIIIFMELLILF